MCLHEYWGYCTHSYLMGGVVSNSVRTMLLRTLLLRLLGMFPTALYSTPWSIATLNVAFRWGLSKHG